MHKYFGEVAYYKEGDEEEKKKAKEYLEFWKKNLILKLQKDSFNVKIQDEQWTQRPSHVISMFNPYAAIGLKLCIIGEWNYEI